MRGGCHCGAVSIQVPAAPHYLNQCHCSLCAKLCTLWGYYPGAAVAIVGTPRVYRRTDMDHPMLNGQFCGACGATKHWSSIEPPADRMGVNRRRFELAELTGIEVRYGDRRKDDSQGPHCYGREPTIFGEAGPIG